MFAITRTQMNYAACVFSGLLLSATLFLALGARYEVGSFNHIVRVYRLDRWTGEISICSPGGGEPFTDKPASYVRCISTDTMPQGKARPDLATNTPPNAAAAKAGLFDDIPVTAKPASANEANRLRPLPGNPFDQFDPPRTKKDNLSVGTQSSTQAAASATHSTPRDRANLEAAGTTILVLIGMLPTGLATALLATAFLGEAPQRGRKIGTYVVCLAIGIVMTIGLSASLASIVPMQVAIRAGIGGAMFGPLAAILRSNRFSKNAKKVNTKAVASTSNRGEAGR